VKGKGRGGGAAETGQQPLPARRARKFPAMRRGPITRCSSAEQKATIIRRIRSGGPPRSSGAPAGAMADHPPNMDTAARRPLHRGATCERTIGERAPRAPLGDRTRAAEPSPAKM